MEIKIYVLSNPITNDIFYVGCTSLELKERLVGHYRKVNEARRGDIKWNNRLSYLDKLLPHKAQITEVDRCTKELKNSIEKKYIEQYKKNHPLTNQTIGGEGGDTWTMQKADEKIKIAELISKKLKGVKKPESFSKNLSVKRTGYGNPSAGKTLFPPIVLESTSRIIIFKNGIESNQYFSNKYSWGNLIATAKHNKVNQNKRYYLKTYAVSFVTEVTIIKDIVESLLEKEGNCYVYDKHTKKITVK